MTGKFRPHGAYQAASHSIKFILFQPTPVVVRHPAVLTQEYEIKANKITHNHYILVENRYQLCKTVWAGVPRTQTLNTLNEQSN